MNEREVRHRARPRRYRQEWTMGGSDVPELPNPFEQARGAATATAIEQMRQAAESALEMQQRQLPERVDNGARLSLSDLTGLTNRFIGNQMVDEVYRESPIFYQLRDPMPQTFTSDNTMGMPVQVDPNAPHGTVYWFNGAGDPSPLRWSRPPNDPMDFPTNGPYWHGRRPYAHFSEVASWPTPSPTPREIDLEHRLNEVREALGLTDRNRRLRSVVFVDRGGDGFPQQVHLSPQTMERLNEALEFESAPVQDPDSYVYRYEFMNGQAIKVDEKLEGGTILDAAARPVRKFRLVEE